MRSPELKKLAKAIKGTPEAAAFLEALPHTYLEENNLHALLLNGLRDYEALQTALERFLPHVDNWATCDTLNPAAFRKNRGRLLPEVRRWLDSGAVYTVRFAMGTLMHHFLEEDFSPDCLSWVGEVDDNNYYVNMMQAWFFATALAKQWDAALPWLTERRLSPWVHRKTIQKAVESYRITPEQKVLLKSLRDK